MTHNKRNLITFAASLLTAIAASAQVDVEAGITANAGDGDFAPYHITSNRGGTLTQSCSVLLHAAAKQNLDTTSRFAWGFGAELWGGYSSSAKYDRYNTDNNSFVAKSLHPSTAWIQQAYADVKWRSLFATVGAKARRSEVVNASLSSGDLVMSGNARPGFGFSGGLLSFQDVPLTQGWVQAKGEIGYEQLGDGDWLQSHYNHYNAYVTTGYWVHYKKLYLRTRRDRPFMVTIGVQAASQFGGTQELYENGQLVNTVKMSASPRSFFRAIVAGRGGNNPGDSFVEGNHLGTFDMLFEYRLPAGDLLRAYHEKLWEDGSGLGWQNGFDGLYGLEWRSAKQDIVSNVVLEYLDFTNQSGPIHFAPADHPDSPIEAGEATGMDDYYNNYAYNGYQNRGMSIGSPFIKSPIYNTDGYMRFTDNAVRGFHIGVKGHFSPEISWRALLSHRKSWGSLEVPHKGTTATCFMAEASMRPHWMPHLQLTAQVAVDRGSLYGNNFGGMVSVVYHGNFNLFNK